MKDTTSEELWEVLVDKMKEEGKCPGCFLRGRVLRLYVATVNRPACERCEVVRASDLGSVKTSR